MGFGGHSTLTSQQAIEIIKKADRWSGGHIYKYILVTTNITNIQSTTF
jgi:hypothetical protein